MRYTNQFSGITTEVRSLDYATEEEFLRNERRRLEWEREQRREEAVAVAAKALLDAAARRPPEHACGEELHYLAAKYREALKP